MTTDSKIITIGGSYGEFEVDASTGVIISRVVYPEGDDEYGCIEKFNMAETFENIGGSEFDITDEPYFIDIVLCGYTCFDGTIEPPMPTEEKIALREGK